MKESILSFNDRHFGETVYIIGNSDELYYLKNNVKKRLNEKITVGVNYAHVVFDKLTYMLSGHTSHVLYALNFADHKIKKILYQGRKDGLEIEPRILEDIILFNPNRNNNNFPRKIKNENHSIPGASNIGISASSLTYIMGAKKIVYIGFNQKNMRHFYDIDMDLQNEIRNNINKLKEKYIGFKRTKDVFKDYDMFLNFMDDRKKNKNTKYRYNFNKVFKNMFTQFKKEGIEIYSTTKDSVLVDCGAKFIEIEKSLEL